MLFLRVSNLEVTLTNMFNNGCLTEYFYYGKNLIGDIWRLTGKIKQNVYLLRTFEDIENDFGLVIRNR